MRLRFWLGSGALLIVLLFCIAIFFRSEGPLFFREDQRLELGWSGSNDSSIGKILNAYQAEVEKQTNDFKIVTFYGDRLGERESLLEQIRLGQPYLSLMSVGEGIRFSPSLKVLSVPVLFKNAEEIDAVMTSSIGEDIRKELQAEGFHVLGWIPVVSDSLWVGEDKKSVADLKGLGASISSEGLENSFWASYGLRLDLKPRGLWRSDALLGSIGGLVSSSEWLEEQGLFWQFPHRFTIGGVKPLFLVMNVELYEKLPEKVRVQLVESTQKWKSLDGLTLDQENIEKIREKRAIETIVLPPEEYGKINQMSMTHLDKSQQELFAEMRNLLGGHLFFETLPPMIPVGEKKENQKFADDSSHLQGDPSSKGPQKTEAQGKTAPEGGRKTGE